MNFIIPQEVLSIIDTLASRGFKAHIVGGCVRDMLIDRIPNDWDITTSALPEDMLSLFKHTIPTGIKHGTVTVLINRNPYEVTTYRIDGEYTDNRHPDNVIFTDSLEDDLSRRDFTINAMAYNHTSGLIDPFHGFKDLESKIVRCVGIPDNRFNEDALRMIRAIRFANQLNFNIHTDTFAAIKNNCDLILNVSAERIREELCKILLCDKPSYGILLLKESGLLKHILPEIIPSIGFEQQNPHHDKDVFLHTLEVIDNTPKDLIVRLSALLHDIGKPQCFTVDEKGIGHFYGHAEISAEKSEEILKRLKFDNNTIKRVLLLIKEHLSRHSQYKSATLKKFINRIGVENLDPLFELQIADVKGSAPPFDFSGIYKMKEEITKILNEKLPISIKDLAVNGSDLIQIGFKPGKELGSVLGILLEKVLDNPELNNKQQLLELAGTYLNNY